MMNEMDNFVSNKINERDAIKIKLISTFILVSSLDRMEDQNNTCQFSADDE